MSSNPKTFPGLLAQYNMYYLDYTRRICSKCKGTQQQIDRKCGLLRGFREPSCDQMEVCIHRKQKVAKEELFKAGMEDLLERRENDKKTLS